MHVFRLRMQFGWKTPINVPKIVFLGDLTPEMESHINETPKADPYASPRLLSHHARKSVDRSDL